MTPEQFIVEQQLVGALLLFLPNVPRQTDNVRLVIDSVNADLFECEDFREIVRSVQSLADGSRTITPSAIAFATRSHHEAATTAMYECAVKFPEAMDAFLDMVAKRELDAAHVRLSSLPGYDYYSGMKQALDDLEWKIGIKVAQDTSGKDFVDSLSSPISLIPTGLLQIDATIGGFEKGQLVTVAGSPGTGKTAFGCSIARLMAESSLPSRVLYISLEVPARHIRRRLVSMGTRVPVNVIRERRWFGDQLARVVAESNRLDEVKTLTVLPGHGFAASDICAHIESRMYDVVIIDYIQLVKPARRRNRENRATELGEISGTIMQSGKKAGVVVVSMSQLNRESVKTGSPPELWALRDSGSIEQDSDIVLALWHHPNAPEETMQLHVLKNRDGVAGMYVDLVFEKSFSLYRDPATTFPREQYDVGF